MTHVLGIGFSSVVFDDPNFEQLARNQDRALDLGVSFLELPVFAMDMISGGRVLHDQVRRLKTVTGGSGLDYTVHGPIAVNLMQGSGMVERHLRVAKATMDVAGAIGAKHVILHTGTVTGASDAEIDVAFSKQREALFDLAEFAAGHGLIIAVENVYVTGPNEYTATPSRLAREIETIAHPHLRACLDFSHAAIRCSDTGNVFLEEAKALAAVAKHLHIHDSFGDPAQMRTFSRSERVAYGLGDLHLPLGWGSIPWDAIMTSFTFEEDVILNLELPPHYPFALESSIAAMKNMVRQYEDSRSKSLSHD